ncbi:MAG TPA: hypothetical protein DCZ91_22395 [Lachnospiraceae bacterium]|nr:hypothetical protein [Lachnospiraceae bacterium]
MIGVICIPPLECFYIPFTRYCFVGLRYIVLFRVQNEMEYLAPLMENLVTGNLCWEGSKVMENGNSVREFCVNFGVGMEDFMDKRP